MTRTRWIWVALAGLYVAFFGWYTSFEGPLGDDEISGYLAKLEAGDPAPSPERLAMMRRFMEADTGDDFVMINVVDMHQTPLQVEGVEAGESSDEVLAKYMQYMYPALFARACHPVLFGDAASPALELMNADGMERWSFAAGMRYRSRRDLLDIATNPAFAGSHAFKVAAMQTTIAFPIDPWVQLGDPRLVLGLLLGGIGCGLGWREAVRRSAVS